MLGVFIGTILALLITDYDVPVLLALGLAVLATTRSFACETKDNQTIVCSKCGTTDSFGNKYQCDGYKEAFKVATSGFGDEVTWLVFSAFLLGRAVEITHLGRRLSLLLIRLFARFGMLGLGYALCLAELILAPFIPSNAARGGSIVAPITLALSQSLDSTPENGNIRIGAFLNLVAAHANLMSAAMYLTGTAPNPIIQAKAKEILNVDLSWGVWILGSCIPVTVVVILVPFVIFWFTRTMPGDAKEAVSSAREVSMKQLAQMGRMSNKEWMLLAVLIACLGLWTSAPWTHFSASAIAFSASVALIYLNVLDWHEDVLGNKSAWDILFFLGGFLVLADQLTQLDITDFLGNSVASSLGGIQGLSASIILFVVYFFTGFIFASMTAHAIAFSPLFLAASKALNAPSMLSAALIGYGTGLSGCWTNFSSGSIVIYYGHGYVSQQRWFGIGAIIAFIHMIVLLSVGLAWWKIIGWYLLHALQFALVPLRLLKNIDLLLINFHVRTSQFTL